MTSHRDRGVPEHTRQFDACRSILSLTDQLCERNQAKIILDQRRYATMAAGSRYGKARKQMEAVYLLASHGYGEDAMILARSLVNVCIDLRYIAVDADQAETRARQWTAKGRVERRKFAKRVGTIAPDETTVDWDKEEALADEWPKTVERRAKAAGLENFYNLPYRHGSSFEHSDSWSATWKRARLSCSAIRTCRRYGRHARPSNSPTDAEA